MNAAVNSYYQSPLPVFGKLHYEYRRYNKREKDTRAVIHSCLDPYKCQLEFKSAWKLEDANGPATDPRTISASAPEVGSFTDTDLTYAKANGCKKLPAESFRPEHEFPRFKPPAICR